MAMDIQSFKSSFKDGGARTSLFQVQFVNPANGNADLDVPFKAKATSLPAVNVTPIEVHYFGRPIKVAGNRVYDDWNVTILDDEDHKIRNAMEQWANTINGFRTNVRKFATSSPREYKSDALVTHFSQTGEELRTYKIVGIFPTAIAEIPLSWETEAVSEFQVTFAVDYWVIDSSISSDLAGGE